LTEELEKLATQLDNLPDEDSMRAYVEKVDDVIFLYDDHGNNLSGGNDLDTFLNMSRADQQRLIEAVFSKPLTDGRPSGVYIKPLPAPRHKRTRSFRINLKGQLEFDSVIAADASSPHVVKPSSPHCRCGRHYNIVPFDYTCPVRDGDATGAGQRRKSARPTRWMMACGC
jgi:hypothetical protein